MDAGFGFTYSDYEELLSALLKADYRFMFFHEDEGEAGVFLRHDVDKQISFAVQMAEIEARRDIRSSYFFLLRSALYNLLEPEAARGVRRILDLGHCVGLHCDESRMPGGTDFDRSIAAEIELMRSMVDPRVADVVTFHNPSKKVIMRTPAPGTYVSGYGPTFMLPSTKYISESNANWREGSPIPMLLAREHHRLQILVHPVWWCHSEPVSKIRILEDVLMARAREMDSYLTASNHLWAVNKDEGRVGG